MENIITGSKTITVKVDNVGKNFLPFNEDLKDKVIRYIDIVPMGLLPQSNGDVFTDFENCTLTLADYNGNSYFAYNVPLDRYNPIKTGGVRLSVNKKVSLQNSYIFVAENNAQIGNSVVVVIYYEDEFYSYPNTTNDLAVDAIEVKINSLDFNNMLPDNRTLVNKRIRGLALPQVTLTPSFTKSVNQILINNKWGYITLQKNNYVILDHLPLFLLLEPYYLASLQFRNIELDLINSYITIGGSTAKINEMFGEDAQLIIDDLLAGSVFLNVLYENQ